MNEPLTTTQAYKVFAELYKKQRPPELQKQVEEIVAKYSDIFVRIQKIRELDLQHEREESRKRKINGFDSNEKEKTPLVPVTKPALSIQQTKPKTKKGFFENLFKGNEIIRWGEQTGTLIHGLFGFNLKLSPNVEKTFQLFEEKQIIDFLKSISFFIHRGWDDFHPSKYNIIITLHQFFQEYLKVPLLLKREDPPSSLINNTLKMQVFYAHLLMFPDYVSMLEEDFIEWLKKQKETAPYIPNTISVVKIITRFEQRRPKFTDIILAFYVLDRKKIITWNDLVKELQIKPPVVDRYRAPEKVLNLIYQKVEKLKMEIQKRESTLQDINFIKSKYFLINEKGKINTDFLNPIVFHILKRQFGESRITKDFIKNHIAEPHRLLWIIFQDFDVNFSNFFVSTITIQDVRGQNVDVIIFKNNLFKKEMELYSEIQKELQEFHKQYKNAQINFPNLYLALKNKSGDIVFQNLLKIITKSNNFFRRMINNLRLVLENHEEATELETKGKLKEQAQKTKLLPIEELVKEPRFIPYADSKIVAAGRIHNFYVKNALEEIVKNFYNYLYLFRDSILLESLSSVPRLESEIQIYRKKLLQYGIE